MLACYALSCDSSDVIVITAYVLIPLVLTWLADHFVIMMMTMIMCVSFHFVFVQSNVLL